MASTLKWYRTLRPRVLIDLVSDYAGKELFLVEGDSLLLECFSDTRIDFDDGFQLLHAVYVVESLLENMVRRNCNFHIAFFESHRNLCFPPTAKLVNGPKYLLARSVIFQHLERHVQQSHPGIQIHSFASLQDQDFSAYLDRTSLYFVMCHDGARHRSTKKWRAKGNVAPSINDDRSKKIVFRGMMHYFIRRGLNVALIHSLERRDTKLLATIVEGWHRDLVDAITAEIEYLEALSSLIQRDNGKQSQPKKSARSKANYEMEELATNHISSLKERSQQPPSFQQVAQALEFLRPKWSERMFVTVAAVTRSLIDYREPTAASTTISKPSAGTTTTAVAAARSTATVLLLQALVLDHVPLSDRRFLELHISGPNLGLVQRFVMTFVCEAHLVLIDENWTLAAKQEQMENILADLFDGRLFWVIAYLLQEHKSKQFDSFHTDINRLIASVSSLCNVDLPRLCKIPGLSINAVKSSPDDRKIGKDDFVLPFSSSVFDKHLSCIQTVDDEHGDSSTCMSAKILREVSFWHNARKSTQPKRARFSRPPEQEARFLRSNQRYMAEMNAYAASLTGALGKALTPETIAVQSKQKPTSQTKKQKHEGQKATPVGVATPINPEKKDQDKERALRAWAAFRKDHLDNDSDQMARVKRLTKYFAGLPASKARDVQEEVELYKIQSLLVVWRRTKNLSIAAQMWSTIQSVANVPRGLSHVVVDALKSTIMALKLPDLRIDPTRDLRALTFRFEIPSLDPTELELRLPPQNFELLHAGPYMDRNMGSRPDARVRFAPDAWQRQVLDELDARHSVFVVAPTSAGKTFISFYAMEKVLRESDDGVLVYVAPTKALVNQVAAEIQARFRKTFKHPHGRSVWALHTRDYVINNPLTCQILVTVPQILQIMLLSPSNSRSWSPKLRTIVIDEIHAIGQEDGLIYEQLLLMAPCPIIALSATVGNPESFNDWLHSTQKAAGFDLTLISHPHRWSDLRKFTFAPPKVFYFDGLPSKSSYEALGLDGVSGFDFLHPVASLIDRSRGIPDDLNLEARDCFTLYQALVKHQRQDFPITEDLDPHRFFHLSPITKAQVITWEDRLKEILREWMVNVASPFEQVLEELRTTASNEVEDLLISKDRDNYAVSQDSREVDADDPRSTTLPMLLKMHEADALPALLFNYDRSQCEKIAKAILEELETSEAKWKCESRKWKKTIRDWEEWKAAHASKKIQKASKSANVKQRARKEDGNAESVSKLDTIIEAASQAIDPFANFNPNDAVEDFSFARKSHGPVSEVEAGFQKLRWAGVSEWLINCFSRGVGVHHAGLNKRYRQMVEVWFRKGFLRVVIATGTLSLGINAPARTVVFSSDSIFLTALNFRQSAGRAGRRGFDLLGNVVFQNVSMSKACRLLSSRLPDLNGHFPITTSLVLRLFILLKESQEAPFAVKMVDSLLSQPRMYMGGSSFREQVLHHLRFSIEYLRRQSLLGPVGDPINFASCISYLHYTENSGFAFHALLKDGYFHSLCKHIKTKESQTLRNLMLILAHIFSRRPCHQADAEVVKRSASIVFLPSLPKAARAVLLKHNKETLSIFTAYVKTFSRQHMSSTKDNTLPLSGLSISPIDRHQMERLSCSLPATLCRSAFVALSGHDDEFSSIHDLCSSARCGVFLEESVIPYIDVDEPMPRNAYLYDFYMHGSIKPLEVANGLRPGDVWYVLNDFSLILATIVKALQNFMSVDEQADLDMLNIVGSGDAEQLAADDRAPESESLLSSRNPQPAQPQVTGEKAKTEAVAESWDDEELGDEHETAVAESWDDDDSSDDEESSDDESDDLGTQDKSSRRGQPFKPWGDDEGKGLLNVLKAFQKLRTEFDTKFKAIWS